MTLKNSFSLTGISGEVQIALHSSRFMPRSRRGWSVSNLPFVIRAGFWIKIACFAIGDQYFTYHFRYKMVSDHIIRIFSLAYHSEVCDPSSLSRMSWPVLPQ